MDWPEITKDTPLEEIKRIHQHIWQYVVENGKKPDTPYVCGCSACEYVGVVYGGYSDCFKNCPIAWRRKGSCKYANGEILPCGEEYYTWLTESRKSNAEKIRDIPFKYELEKKGAEE